MGAEVAWEYIQVATEYKTTPMPGQLGWWEQRWHVNLVLVCPHDLAHWQWAIN